MASLYSSFIRHKLTDKVERKKNKTNNQPEKKLVAYNQ
jgi:hypothetical protein